MERTDSSSMNKRAVESLIKCGAMDSLGATRAQLMAVYEKLINGIHADKKKNIEGQSSLFDNPSEESTKDNFPDLKEFPQNILLTMEKEMLGIYVTGHPLEPYKEKVEKLSTLNTIEILDSNKNEDIANLKDGSKITLCGIIVDKKNKITKNNNMMAFITLEDLVGSIECIVFPMTYERYTKHINEDDIVVIEGKINLSEVEDPKIIAEKITPLSLYNTDKLYLKIESSRDSSTFEGIKSILRKYKGDTPVYLYMEKEKSTAIADRDIWIDTHQNNVIDELKLYLGEECVKLK